MVITVIAVLGKNCRTVSHEAEVREVISYHIRLLLSTPVCSGRHNGVGINSTCGHLVGILAPLVRLPEVYHYTIPMLIYGIITVGA